MSSFRKTDNLIIILLLPQVLYELYSRLNTVWSDSKHLTISGIDRIHRHFLDTHIGCSKLSYVCRWLGLCQHSIKKSDDLGRICTMALIVLYERANHHQLSVEVGLLAQKNTIEHGVSLLFLTCGIIIVVERHLGIRVVRFFVKHMGKQLISLFLTLMLHEPITQHGFVDHIKRMRLSKRFEFLIGRLRIIH